MSKEQVRIDPDRKSLVLEQRYRLYDSLILANNNMDGRVNSLLQAGSIIIGLVTILNISRVSGAYDAILSGKILQNLELLFVLLVFMSFITMVVLSVYVLRPIGREAPGISDWDETFTFYLYSEECFEQVLIDLLKSIKEAEALNIYKAKWVPRLAYLLISQVVFLALAVLFA